MDVLLLLCQQKGLVVSADEIVAQCWPNAPIGDNPVHKAITNLRRALGDKAAAPPTLKQSENVVTALLQKYSLLMMSNQKPSKANG